MLTDFGLSCFYNKDQKNPSLMISLLSFSWKWHFPIPLFFWGFLACIWQFYLLSLCINKTLEVSYTKREGHCPCPDSFMLSRDLVLDLPDLTPAFSLHWICVSSCIALAKEPHPDFCSSHMGHFGQDPRNYFKHTQGLRFFFFLLCVSLNCQPLPCSLINC